MDNACYECGAKFKADCHEELCPACKRREDAMYANVDPTKPGNRPVYVYATHGRRGGSLD